MSRRRKALIATAFTYSQWVITAFTGLFLTRFLIRSIGQDLYGMWLATGALLAYAALADLGILGVMPWLIAEADGARDAVRLRSLVAHGLAASFVGGLLYLFIAICLWSFLPGLLHLSPADREALRGPVLAMVLVTALGYPLRLIAAVRQGLQDYSFLGILGITQTLLNLCIVTVLTLSGAGLYGIALGSAVPGVVAGLVALARTMSLNQAILAKWPPLRLSTLGSIVSSGAGQWLGSLGWQLAFASDAVVIAYLGHRELVPMFVVTSRLGLTLMQLSWALPDNTSVGIAQLNAEGNVERTAEVIAALLRIHLLAAGLIACAILAGNFGFVTAWVGRDLYGGARLNAVLALNVIALSAVHGLLVPAAVLGRRMSVGLITLLNGGLHVAFAVLLGRAWGLSGVALAAALSAAVTTIPGGLKMLTAMTSLRLRDVVLRVGLPWLGRTVPWAAVAGLAGWAAMRTDITGRLGNRGTLLGSLFAGVLVGAGYLFGMRPIMRELPFGPRLRRALATLRLVKT